MLYDTTADVIRKALRGLDLAPSAAAARCGLPERSVIAASREPAEPLILERLAPALGLDPAALSTLPNHQPEVPFDDSIHRLELPFDDETVNAWLIDAGGGNWLLFDSGDGPRDLREELDRRRIAAVDVLITHPHHDHIGGIPGLSGLLRSLAGPTEGEVLAAGDRLQRGRLTISVIGLPGHHPEALGYRVAGLAQPVCVTGDALFAGSIGGCAPGEPYRQALAALREEVMSLPDETILLPGHGPATTVGAERTANPFLAGARLRS
jgi:glyoxylase-like metal-dependent hydrolase (beta-lactamase superfamily II)